MLQNRLLSACVLISGSLVFVALDAWAYNFGCPGLWMLPLGFYLILGSAYECTAMVARSPLGSITGPALVGCAAVMLAGCVPTLWPLGGATYPSESTIGLLGWPLIASGLALVGCFAWFFSHYQPNNGDFLRAILSGWVSCYFGICFSFAVAIRMITPPQWGLFLLLGFILVTKFADSGAYFSGRALGRNKLCKQVSPNKTVEGLVGGMITACLGAWLYFGPFADWMFADQLRGIRWQGVLLLGVGLTLAGLAGDLLESVFKREMGCKDSGTLLPGLGGLWDVTDSILPAMVVGFVINGTGLLGMRGQEELLL